MVIIFFGLVFFYEIVKMVMVVDEVEYVCFFFMSLIFDDWIVFLGGDV